MNSETLVMAMGCYNLIIIMSATSPKQLLIFLNLRKAHWGGDITGNYARNGG